MNEGLCLSLLFAPDENGDARESLDIQVADMDAFGLWVAASHGLLALHAPAGGGNVSGRREAALARAAPQLHSEMVQREALAMEELRAQVRCEVDQTPCDSRCMA